MSHRLLHFIVAGAAMFWFITSLVLFIPAQESETLEPDDILLMRLVAWVFFAVTLFANFTWTLDQRLLNPVYNRRLSDSQWRGDLLMRLALSMALFAVIVNSFFISDNGLFEIEVGDRLLLTRLTPFEALLCPLAFAPIFFSLLIFAIIARTRGNAIYKYSL
jgi:hypothetical protein